MEAPSSKPGKKAAKRKRQNLTNGGHGKQHGQSNNVVLPSGLKKVKNEDTTRGKGKVVKHAPLNNTSFGITPFIHSETSRDEKNSNKKKRSKKPKWKKKQKNTAPAAEVGEKDQFKSGDTGAGGDTGRLKSKKEKRIKGKGSGAADVSSGTTSNHVEEKAPLILGEDLHHPFETEYGDHFETSMEAYKDVVPCLHELSKLRRKSSANLAIYDPFYCAGAVVSHMAQLGFPGVINRNRDFYKDVQEKATPEFDVLMTNPPFSGDHKKYTVGYAFDSGKPWLLLLPNYVATKQYYRDLIREKAGGAEPFYIRPSVRC